MRTPSNSIWLSFAASLAVASVAGVALGEPPHVAPLVPATRAPAIKAPAAKPPTPKVPTAAPMAPAAAATPLPKTVTIARSPGGAPGRSAAASGPAIAIEPQVSDPGLTITSEGNRVFLRGVAQGPAVKYSDDIAFLGGKPTKLVDYSVSRGASFTLDHEKMPDFSADADYTRKNKWYFAHLASTGTQKGQSSVTVARALADSLNKGLAYEASVTETADGAVIDVKPL